MKNIIAIFIFALLSSNLFAQATASTNEVISAANIATINLDLDSDNIEIKETKGSRIIIESHIKLANIDNSTMLDFLVNSGRYALESKTDGTSQTLDITRKKALNVLLVKGEECKEIITYIVLVPESVKVVNTKSATASIK